MRHLAVLAAVVVAALGWAGSALAGAPDGIAGPWADYVVGANQGCAFRPPDMTTCVSVPPQRSDPQSAVGPAESPPGPNQNIPEGSFYSIGFTDPSRGTAFITLGFDNAICNVPGQDVAVDLFEITQEPYPNEVVNVFVSADNVNYVFAGTVTKEGTVGMPASVPVANRRNVPVAGRNTSIRPWPGPGTSSSFSSFCLPKVTKTWPAAAAQPAPAGTQRFRTP